MRSVELVCRHLAEQGFKRAVIRVHPDNVASIKVAERAGFIRDGMVQASEGTLQRYTREID